MAKIRFVNNSKQLVPVNIKNKRPKKNNTIIYISFGLNLLSIVYFLTTIG